MIYRIIIYTASSRCLSEKCYTKEQCIKAMEKIDRAILNDDVFWFGRSRVNACHVEAFFATENGQELYDDEARRVDPAELIEGREFPCAGYDEDGKPVGIMKGMWRDSDA